MYWEKKITIRITVRRVVGAVLAASTVANLIIVGVVFGADSSSATPTITSAWTSSFSTATLSISAAATGRDIHIYMDPHTRWPAHGYAWDHTDGVPTTHECIHAHRDTCLFAGLELLYQEVLLAKIPCPTRRYLVLVSIGNKIDRSGINVGELPGNQPDLYRADPFHASLALPSHNSAKCYGYTFRDGNTITNRDGYSNEYVHALAHLYGYPDQHIYTQRDSNLYTFPYINGYAVANIYKHGNIHANEYTNGVSECWCYEL